MSEISLRLKKPKMLIIALALVFLLAMGLFTWNFIKAQYAPVDPDDHSYVDIIIPSQSTASQIAGLLKKNDLIHSEAAFLSYCKKEDYDNRLKAGHYRLSRSHSLAVIASHIAMGRVVNISFTIPEGYTVAQIKELLVREKVCSAEAWELAVKKNYNYSFLKEVPAANKNPLEGFLFPDTYSISEDCSTEQVIEMMLSNFEQVWMQQFALEAKAQKRSVYDAVILASLIEKEARVASERPIISGVIKNRLEDGMRLQIDATILYALQEHKTSINYRDLEVASPYNTYKYAGLPPGPIACPGQAAIAAALKPSQHNYYYYVYKGDGSHYFSRTFAEHLQAQRKYSQ
ncbi:MAG: endolytic transglycosylase MltG [Syntrophomonadaceae bacterium]|nr:endolytic transglycosylase MltG [Syntrophomonadaceae bacterium]